MVDTKELEEKQDDILRDKEGEHTLRKEAQEGEMGRESNKEEQGVEGQSDIGRPNEVESSVRDVSKTIEYAIVKDGKRITKEVTISTIKYGDIVRASGDISALISELSAKGITFDTFSQTPSLSAVAVFSFLPLLTKVISKLIDVPEEELCLLEMSDMLKIISTIWTINEGLIVELIAAFLTSMKKVGEQ